MNLERDLQKLKKEKQQKDSATAQLRKRSRDSIARPRAEKNILSTNPEMQKI
jgi:hypothetical protein